MEHSSRITRAVLEMFARLSSQHALSSHCRGARNDLGLSQHLDATWGSVELWKGWMLSQSICCLRSECQRTLDLEGQTT